MQFDAVVAAAGIGAPVWAGTGAPDRVVTGVSVDSRRVEPGAIFCCVRGGQADGHDHAAEAVARGAVALVVDHPLDLDVVQLVVDDVRTAAGPIAAAWFGHPSRSMRVVGVTGTNGKTTVTHLVESILRARGVAVAVVGTVGIRFGGITRPATHTTPDAVALQALLAELRSSGADAIVLEVSSHALDQGRVLGIDFEAVGFTNLRRDHLDYHGTDEAYAAAKERLFRRAYAPVAVIDIDDPVGPRYAASARHDGVEVVTVSSAGADARLTARDVQYGSDATRWTVHDAGADTSFDVSLPLVGAFNVANAMCAIGLATALGTPTADIVAGLTEVPQVPGRLERIADPAGRTVLVDYAHTADALEAVLQAVRPLVGAGGRVVVVYGCGGDRDRAKRPAMGAAVAAGADIAVLTSDNPRSEDPAAIVDDVLAGVPPERRPHVELDRRAAIRWALRETGRGDVVVVAGKGHESGQTTAGVTVDFDDRDVTRALLAEVGA